MRKISSTGALSLAARCSAPNEHLGPSPSSKASTTALRPSFTKRAHICVFAALVLTSACHPDDVTRPPQPRTWYVKPDLTGDAPTIQAAVDSCKPNDMVLLAPGTYSWTRQAPLGHSMITVKSGITIRGEAGAATTIIDGQNEGRLIYCETAGIVRFERLTLRHGLTRPSTSPDPPFVYQYGGAIYADEGTQLMVISCVISENRALDGGRGAGIYCFTAMIHDTEIRGNLAGRDCYGIGVWCGGELTVSNSAILNHHGSGDPGSSGAGISTAQGMIENTRFEGNSVTGQQGANGGGLVIGTGSVVGCTFVQNTARVHSDLAFTPAYGGALLCGGPCTISLSVFSDNLAAGAAGAAGAGGAIGSISNERVTVENCTFIRNRAEGGQSDPLGTLPISGVGVANGSVRASLFVWNDGRAVNGSVTTSCSDFYGNTPSDSLRGVEQHGNFSADPLFCVSDPLAARDFRLHAESPCAPGRHPTGADCGSIGAAAFGCVNSINQGGGVRQETP